MKKYSWLFIVIMALLVVNMAQAGPLTLTPTPGWTRPAPTTVEPSKTPPSATYTRTPTEYPPYRVTPTRTVTPWFPTNTPGVTSTPTGEVIPPGLPTVTPSVTATPPPLPSPPATYTPTPGVYPPPVEVQSGPVRLPEAGVWGEEEAISSWRLAVGFLLVLILIFFIKVWRKIR